MFDFVFFVCFFVFPGSIAEKILLFGTSLKGEVVPLEGQTTPAS